MDSELVGFSVQFFWGYTPVQTGCAECPTALGQFGAGQFGAGLFGVTDNLVPIFTGQKRQFMMENFYLDLHF